MANCERRLLALKYYTNTTLKDKMSTSEHFAKLGMLSINQIAASIKLAEVCKSINIENTQCNYRDKIYQRITSTQKLVGIHNDAAHKSWSKYTTDNKVGKVN